MRPRSHGAGCAALAMLLLLALLLGRAGAQQPEAAPVYPTAPGPDISWGDEYRETTLSQPSVAQPGAPAPTRASEAVTETAPFSGVTDAEETFAMKPDKFALPEIPLAFSMAATTETSPPQGTPLAVSGFVGRNGTNFVVNGKVHFFPGSNDYFLLLRWVPASLKLTPAVCVGAGILLYSFSHCILWPGICALRQHMGPTSP